jgi:prepilin-type N-terminal cleavage/methylation domain-containing protein
MIRHGDRRGFTLVEMLISISLMMTAIGIVIPFFLVQNRSLQSQSGRLDAQLNINFGLDAIDRELRVAGVGVTQRQPMLVQAASDAITFNGDVTSGTPADFSAVYYDPERGCAARSGGAVVDRRRATRSGRSSRRAGGDRIVARG